MLWESGSLIGIVSDKANQSGLKWVCLILPFLQFGCVECGQTVPGRPWSHASHVARRRGSRKEDQHGLPGDCGIAHRQRSGTDSLGYSEAWPVISSFLPFYAVHSPPVFRWICYHLSRPIDYWCDWIFSHLFETKLIMTRRLIYGQVLRFLRNGSQQIPEQNQRHHSASLASAVQLGPGWRYCRGNPAPSSICFNCYFKNLETMREGALDNFQTAWKILKDPERSWKILKDPESHLQRSPRLGEPPMTLRDALIDSRAVDCTISTTIELMMELLNDEAANDECNVEGGIMMVYWMIVPAHRRGMDHSSGAAGATENSGRRRRVPARRSNRQTGEQNESGSISVQRVRSRSQSRLLVWYSRMTFHSHLNVVGNNYQFGSHFLSWHDSRSELISKWTRSSLISDAMPDIKWLTGRVSVRIDSFLTDEFPIAYFRWNVFTNTNGSCWIVSTS